MVADQSVLPVNHFHMEELKILYLEDSAHDAELAYRVLNKSGIRFSCKIVDNKDDYLKALEKYAPDIILSDHALFQYNSLEALKEFKASGLKIPFILVTGTVSEEFAVNILKEGADDYLLKSNLTRLPSAIINAIEKYRFARERQVYLDNVIANESLMRDAESLAKFGSWQCDQEKGVMQWSEGIFRILGYSSHEEIVPGHDSIAAHIHKEDMKRYIENIILQNRPEFLGELRVKDRSGKLKYVFFQSVGTFDGDGRLANQIGFMQDVTEKKLLEKELAKQVVAQQRLMAEVAIQAQERERKFLGQELHDNINQILTGSKIFLRIAANSADESKKTEFLNKGFEQINEAVAEIRSLSKSLVAPTLGELGLRPALEELIDDINKSMDMHITFDASNFDDPDMQDAMALMFYRIAQEQINNIRKHAFASKVHVLLNTDAEHYFFSISDDGVGFDTTKRSNGLGLLSIKSRVDFYSGIMNITAAPGKGCTISVKVPKQ